MKLLFLSESDRAEIVTLVIPVQPTNAVSLMRVTLSGIAMLAKRVQP